MKRLWNILLIFLNIKTHELELVLEGPTKLRIASGYFTREVPATARLFRCKLTGKEVAWVVHGNTTYNISPKQFYHLKPKVIHPHK
jgi:hypothetical protein